MRVVPHGREQQDALQCAGDKPSSMMMKGTKEVTWTPTLSWAVSALARVVSPNISILEDEMLRELRTVKSRKSQGYEPLLLENEREAVADLLQYLESAQFIPKSSSIFLSHKIKTGRRQISSRARRCRHSRHYPFRTT